MNISSWTGWALVALLSFHAAQILGIGWLMVPCGYALMELSRAPTRRKVFYPLLALGFLFYAPQLGFFWGIFGPAAIALWLVLAFWIACFGLVLRAVRLRFGDGWMLALAPFLWTGLEYFRCELYYLRFGWLTFGMAGFSGMSGIQWWGTFGLSFLCMALAATAQAARARRVLPVVSVGAVAVAAIGFMQAHTLNLPGPGFATVEVAGVQLEFPSDEQVVAGLKQARAAAPTAQLFMLSEYTFQEPVPRIVRDWCAENQVYLVAGGKEPAGGDEFYDMAYVVGPTGEILFQQGKSVPIQFFRDGLPAPERRVWESPWGKMGILTCYDLSYTRVVDDFVRLGAVALLNPTMDVVEWGEQEHRLHSRVAPLRAAEYRIPIFRVASSGISQLVTRSGEVAAQAPFPGDGAIISGRLQLDTSPRLPVDRWLAPGCVGITACALLVVLRPKARKTEPQTVNPI